MFLPSWYSVEKSKVEYALVFEVNRAKNGRVSAAKTVNISIATAVTV